MIRWVLPLLLSAIPATAFSQASDTTARRHILGIGAGANQVRDDNLHPKASTGYLVALSYATEKHDRRWKGFELMVSVSRLKAAFEDVSLSAHLRIDGSYHQAFDLGHSGPVSWRLGPEAILSYQASYFPNWDDSHLYWADFVSLGCRATAVCVRPRERDWSATVSVPLVSAFSRPERYRLYKIDDIDFGGIVKSLNDRPSFGYPGRVLDVRLRVEYRFPVMQTRRQALLYSFEYLYMKRPGGAPYRNLMHRFGIRFIL